LDQLRSLLVHLLRAGESHGYQLGSTLGDLVHFRIAETLDRHQLLLGSGVLWGYLVAIALGFFKKLLFSCPHDRVNFRFLGFLEFC
jgi:hypothetical protein